MTWYLYILECADGSLYTGITTDTERRVSEHNKKTGSKSVRGKLPVKVVYTEMYNNRSEASVREYEVKKLSREEKMKLVQGA
jgi:putative endonuclease